MRLIAILALLVGLTLAGTAVYFVAERFREMEARLAAVKTVTPIETAEVIVAKVPLRYGDLLSPESVAVARYTKESVPANAFKSLEELLGATGTKPRSILRSMDPGEPILGSKVTKFGELAGMAQRLEPGQRAFTIPVSVDTGVSGFVTVGDRVDIFWTGNDGIESITKQILESVPVIAIDQKSDEDRKTAAIARTVTVAVTPGEVAVLTHADSSGRLTLALRGNSDTDLIGEVKADQRSVTGREEVVAPVKAPEKTIVVRRGTEKSTVTPESADAPPSP